MNKSYHSYLLRIWQSDERGHPIWLASLEDPHTRRIIHFKSLEELWHYIKNQAAVDKVGFPDPDLPKAHDD